YAERVIRSIRHECLDHVIVLTEAGLRRILARYGVLPRVADAFVAEQGCAAAPANRAASSRGRWSPFRRSAVCTIGTTGEPPKHRRSPTAPSYLSYRRRSSTQRRPHVNRSEAFAPTVQTVHVSRLAPSSETTPARAGRTPFSVSTPSNCATPLARAPISTRY